jgi:hypothetical protein
MNDEETLLTLYFFPGDVETLDDKSRFMDSLEKVNCHVVFLDHRDELQSCDVPDTEWWGFLFGNEWFDLDMANVLDVYLLSDFDAITFFKDIEKENGDKAVFLATRIFRTNKVPLGIETYKEVEGLKFVKALDGWIREKKQ